MYIFGDSHHVPGDDIIKCANIYMESLAKISYCRDSLHQCQKVNIRVTALYLHMDLNTRSDLCTVSAELDAGF